MAINLCKKLGLQLKRNKVKAAHCNSRKEDSSIIIKVKSRKTAQKILSKDAKHKCRKLRIANFQYQMPLTNDPRSAHIGKVFVNESLISRLMNLLCLTIIKKGYLGYKLVCLQNDKIFIRKDENSDLIAICYAADWDKLV